MKVTDPLRVLVVTGAPTPQHHPKLAPTSFYTLFEGYNNIAWDHAISDEAAFASDLREKYDVLVLLIWRETLSLVARKNLQSFIESGKGIVVLHSTLASYNGWKWWWRDVVGGKYQYVTEDTNDMPAADYRLGERIVANAAAEHPITAAVGSFELCDETYKGLWISPQAQVLYRTDNPTSDGPIVWISPYARSRVVVIQPGHGHAAHRDAGYRALVYHSIVWVSAHRSLIFKSVSQICSPYMCGFSDHQPPYMGKS